MRKFIAPGIGLITGRKRYAYYYQIRGNEWQSEGETHTMQQKMLTKLLQNAKKTVPFYRELLQDIDIPSGPEIIDTLSQLHIISKKMMQKAGKRMISDQIDKKKIMLGYTGGSTGNPLKIYFDSEFLEKKEAAFLRSLTWGSWEPGELILMLWGGLQELNRSEKRSDKIKRCLTGVHTIGCYKYNSDIMDGWLDYLNRYQIQFIYGYASSINNLALHQKKRGIKIPRIRGIFTTAEMLTPEYRRNIEEVFQCKVYNQYGSREVVNISAECEKGSMHVISDMIYPEFMKVNQDENHYHIVLTSFTNQIMPFIRYDIGDYVSPKNGKCPCGRTFPLVDMSIGRKNDHIVIPNGNRIYPSYFIHLLDGVPGIISFQFRQIDPNYILLQIVSDSTAGDKLTELQAHLQKTIRNDLNWYAKVDVQPIDSIPIPESGKHRYVITECMD